MSYKLYNPNLYARGLGIPINNSIVAWHTQYKTKGTNSFSVNNNQAVGNEVKEMAIMKKKTVAYNKSLKYLKSPGHHIQEPPAPQ